LTLCELLAAGLRDTCGMTEQAAKDAAVQLIAWGAERGHSGSEYYWPARATLLSAEERDALIRKEFSGGNLKEVCKKFGCSHVTVYRAMHKLRN
jgi:Mor family transcriptional regulator